MFYSRFKKSIVEYTQKFVAKCCQIVVYELLGLYVTEPFVQHELCDLISDPILDELYPRYKHVAIAIDKSKRKESADSVSGVDPDTAGFGNVFAQQAMKEYKRDTRHSRDFFEDQSDRVRGMLLDLGKRFSIFQSKVASQEARSSRQAETHVVDMRGVEAIRLPGERTVEEIIMENNPYAYIMRSSQLSPFMANFAAKLFTTHDVAINCKLADTPDIRSAFKNPLEFHKASSVAALVAAKALSHYIVPPQRPQVEPRFENWLKQDLGSGYARQAVDRWYKEHGNKIVFEEEQYQHAGPAAKKPDSRQVFNPEERLAENTMFNDIFGSDIGDTLHTLASKQRSFGPDVRNFALSPEKKKKRRLPHLTLRSGKSVDPSADSSRQDKEDTYRELLPRIVKSCKHGGGQTNQMKLTNIVKKLGFKYIDRNAIAEERQNAVEQDKLKELVRKIKGCNGQAKERLARILGPG